MKTSRFLLGLLSATLVALAPLPSFAAASEPPHISFKFEGGLREAIQAIATKGHINLVVLGDVDNEHAEVFFEDVTPEEALNTLAKAYHLKAEHEGKVWTLRSDKGAKSQANPSPVPAPPAPPAVAAVPAVPGQSWGVLPKLPPLPPAGDDDDSDAASDARDAAEEAKEAAREAAQEANDARREAADKMRTKIEKLRHHHGDHDFTGTGVLAIPESETYDNAVVYGGSLTINGHLTKDAVCFGCSVHLGPKAEVEGDVVAFGGSITQDEGAVVGGDRVEMGGGGIWRLVGQGVKKGIVHVGNDTSSDSDDSSSHHASIIPELFIQFALYFGLGFLALMFFPSRMKQIEGELLREPLKCGLAGLVGGFALIPLTVLLCITIIGIPFAVVLWILVGLGMAMGFAAVATEIGTRLPILKGSRKTQAAVLALGIAVLLLLQLLSFVGYCVLAVVGCFAFGAIIRTRLGSTPKGFPEPA